jgi:hypothetical protein
MPGFAPLAAAPLASAGVVAPRIAITTGTLALVGRSVGGSTAQAASLQAALVLVGQARSNVAARGVAGTALHLGGEARGSTGISAAASDSIPTDLDARAGVVCALHAAGALTLAGEQRATLGTTCSSAMLLQIRPQSQAALTVDGAADTDVARALSLAGGGQLQVPAQARGAGGMSLAGAAELGLAVSAGADDLLPANGAGQAEAAVRLTADAAWDIDGQASGIALQARVVTLRAEISLQGRAAGNVALVADLAVPLAPRGTGLVQLPVIGAAQAAFGLLRAVTADLAVSAVTHRVLPLAGSATADQVLEARADGAVYISGQIASTAAAAAAVSASFAPGLSAAAQSDAAAQAQSGLAIIGNAAVLAPIRLTAAGDLQVHQQITGGVLATAQAGPAALALDGQARANLQAAAVAGAELAAVSASAGQVGLQGTTALRADVLSDVHGRTALRTDVDRTVLFDGIIRADAAVTVETHQAAVAMSGQSRASLALAALAATEVTIGRDSLGTIAIDAAAIPALGLTLTVRASTVTRGAAGTAISWGGACAASAALIASTSSSAQLGGAGLGLLALAPRAGSAVPLAGIGGAGVTHLAVASNDLRLMDACIGAVAAKGAAAPLFLATGRSALTGAILGRAAQGALPVTLITQIAAALDAIASDALAVSGAATGRLPLDALGRGTFLTARAGGADVAVTGEAIRILSFPGQAHAAVAARALSQSAFAAGLFTRAATSIDLQLKGQALDPQGTASSHAAIDARLSQGGWSSTALIQGYRAPPGLRRSAAPNAAQGGSVVTVLRSGSVLSEPRTGRILQG